MMISKNEMRYCFEIGFYLAQLEFMWGSRFEEARREADGLKNQILMMVDEEDLIVDETDYPSFTNSILKYYMKNSAGKYRLILLGIAFFRAGLLKACKTEETKIEMINLISSPVNILPDLSEAEKENVLRLMLNRAGISIDEFMDELYERFSFIGEM